MQKFQLKGKGTENLSWTYPNETLSFPNRHFLGLFHSSTRSLKGKKMYRWSSVQRRSWPELTGGFNETERNFFLETGKNGVSKVSRFRRSSFGSVSNLAHAWLEWAGTCQKTYFLEFSHKIDTLQSNYENVLWNLAFWSEAILGA